MSSAEWEYHGDVVEPPGCALHPSVEREYRGNAVEPSGCAAHSPYQSDTASGSIPTTPNIGLHWKYYRNYLSDNCIHCKQQIHAYCWSAHNKIATPPLISAHLSPQYG